MRKKDKIYILEHEGIPIEEVTKESFVRWDNKNSKWIKTTPSAATHILTAQKVWKIEGKKTKIPEDIENTVLSTVSVTTKRKNKWKNSRFRQILKRILKTLAILFGSLFIVLAAAFTFLLTSQTALNDDFQITFYQVVSDKISTPFRIALLSDLHNKEFGENNQLLIDEIECLKPDLIVMAGDMVNSYEVDYHVTIDLIRTLHERDIAPIYFGYGNHDLNYYLNTSKDIEPVLEEAGAIMLRDKYKTIQINDNTITIGGLASTQKIYKEYYSPLFIERFQETDGFRLLICHQPDFFITFFNEETPLDADLALCGHAHGGLVRIPSFGALYAPDQGFHPELTEGMHTIGDCKVIISRGLGGRDWQVRINNQPELVIIDVE